VGAPPSRQWEHPQDDGSTLTVAGHHHNGNYKGFSLFFIVVSPCCK